jgi:predicted phosphodiesterase
MAKPVEFQLISDIHVEFPKVRDFLPALSLEPKAPYLALLGDIGYPVKPNYQELLLEMAGKFKTVFVLAGNHEYYKAEYYSTKQKIKEICALRDNLIFMDKTSLLVDGVRVLGTTLWSYVPPEKVLAVANGLNDYHQIYVKDPKTGESELLCVEQSVEWFQDELQWLKEQIALAKQNGERVAVFTHHAPLVRGTSHPRFDNSPINSGFSSDLEAMMGDPIDLWCFGHTHYSSDQVVKGTRVVSNQVGYIAMQEKSGFNPGMVVSVTPRT